MGEVKTAVYPAPPVNRREVLRYAGTVAEDAESVFLLNECLSLVKRDLRYRVAYAVYPVKETPSGLDLGFATVSSSDLAVALRGCERVAVLGATVGIGLDRLVARHSAQSPAKALMLDALGSERVESLVGAFCAELAATLALSGYALRPRYSPGYGDLPLSLQTDIFRALDLPRRVGITLNDTLLMTPSKSVTALAGIFACPKENI